MPQSSARTLQFARSAVAAASPFSETIFIASPIFEACSNDFLVELFRLAHGELTLLRHAPAHLLSATEVADVEILVFFGWNAWLHPNDGYGTLAISHDGCFEISSCEKSKCAASPVW